MNYSEATERFNLEKFLGELTELDFLNPLEKLQSEIRNTESIVIPDSMPSYRDTEDMRHTYVSGLKELSFLIQSGIRPATASEDSLEKFKVVIERLVSKNQLSEDTLRIFQKE